jgi:hypothetical protein
LLGIFFYIPQTQAKLDSDFISSVDVMKYTKDTVINQPSSAEIESIVSAITKNIKPKYIAISIPLDDSTDYPPESKPSPGSAIQFQQKWTDTIHAQRVSVIFRGTFSGIEGIYNFPKLVGADRYPAGTISSAATDGNSTWLGKIYKFILDNPDVFADGDIWALLPERTEGIFSDESSFLAYDRDIQQTYPQFFLDLNAVSAAAFKKINKKVITGMSANNFSEVKSGWLSPELYNSSGLIVVDHYGITHTPQEMESDLTDAYKKYGKPIFLQEWGDYWNKNLNEPERKVYLQSMYAVFKKLADAKILAGFNYWGGWENNSEGILAKNGNGFSINPRGQMLADFFASLDPKESLDPIKKPNLEASDKESPEEVQIQTSKEDNPAFGWYFLASLLDAGLRLLLLKV